MGRNMAKRKGAAALAFDDMVATFQSSTEQWVVHGPLFGTDRRSSHPFSASCALWHMIHRSMPLCADVRDFI